MVNDQQQLQCTKGKNVIKQYYINSAFWVHPQGDNNRLGILLVLCHLIPNACSWTGTIKIVQ